MKFELTVTEFREVFNRLQSLDELLGRPVHLYHCIQRTERFLRLKYLT